jgi:hypothetical protein
MMQKVVRTLVLLALLPAAAHAQHDHAAPDSARLRLGAGAHAVGLLTHASPMFLGESMTEGYLTQPTLMGHAALFGGRLGAQATISLEALTLERGELGVGSYGEGYVDRRHPHTYLHELVLTAMGDVGPVTASATIGRGFAPFGTDDPMMRPFVKFPINHHLGQVLERLIAIGTVRLDRVIVEAGVFNGNEPFDAKDMGSLERFGDSWSARVTLLPVEGLELQASRAYVVSPELPSGGGWDQRKWSVSARHERDHFGGRVYALGEWKRTTHVSRDNDVFAFGSVLGEASFTRGGWTPALRVEYTDRPEEERLMDPFRSAWPHGGTHLLGITKFTSAAVRIEKDLRANALRLAPFIETSLVFADGAEDGFFEPDGFYGSTRIWTFNAGLRVGIGAHHARMGRYGAAVSGMQHTQDGTVHH